jgi:hypothetical protein
MLEERRTNRYYSDTKTNHSKGFPSHNITGSSVVQNQTDYKFGVKASQANLHGDFVQASKLNKFNNFCLYLVGYISGEKWSFVIGYL